MLRAGTPVAAIVLAACGRIGFGTLPAGDAGSDSAGNADAPVRFCSTLAVTFCSDIDGTGLAEWSQSSQANGTIQLDTAETRSAPNALLVDVPTLATGQNASIGVGQPNLGVATTVTTSYWVFIDTAGTSDAALSHIELYDGTQVHLLELVTRAAEHDVPRGRQSARRRHLGVQLL